MDRGAILRFLRRHYHPRQIVISVAGNFEWPSLLRQLDRSFGRYTSPNGSQPQRRAPQARGGVVAKKKALKQIHFCLGARGISQNHPDRYAAYTMNTMLGGGVSSRLFQQVRENRGWAYSIYSMLSSYEDTGLFSVYAATSLETAIQTIRLVMKEMRKFKQNGIDSPELGKAKGYLKGSLMLGLESTNSRMSRLAKDEIYFGRYVPLEEIIKGIDRVQVRQIKKLAEALFDRDSLSLTTLGPLGKKDIPDDILRG